LLNIHKPLDLAMRKHPVSIALSNRVLEKIDKEASKQKLSRSEFVELHFETLFFAEQVVKN
jgi:metal-responsive CopG/Arc/MetJ family transcriptional regulator